MPSAKISAVCIDADGRLCVTPKGKTFPFVYRAGMEVQWSEDGSFLYSPRPREWTYVQWFRQIVDAVRGEYRYELRLSKHTQWINIGAELRGAIQKAAQSDGL
jgi:hypothetical protein